jgi:radical SAM protein with 4Fe4S-binding SPASM domain
MVKTVDSILHTIGGQSVVERDDARYREYRKKWNKWPETYTYGDFPLHLDVEPTNACNLRCPFCATTYNTYSKGFMEEKVWKAVLDESGKNELNSLKFTFRGEPLLHKDLPRMVAYAKEAGILDVYFNTNALRLDDATIRALLDAGLDRISISFEGYTKEVYEKYRVGSTFETVIQNLELLKKIKDERGQKIPLVRIQTVLVPELQGKEEQYAAFWSPKVDEVAYLDMKNEAGNPNHCGISYDWACPMLWQRMTITWDGMILPCIHDIYEWDSFGKIEDISIREAWSSSKQNSYRTLHREGNAHNIRRCDRCPYRESEIRKLRGV